MIVGRICEKHPELGGKRYNDGHCCQCKKDANRKWNTENAERVRENATKRMAKFRKSESGALAVKAATLRHYHKDIESSRAYSREAKKRAYSHNPAREIMRVRSKKLAVSVRTPGWARIDAIEAIYRKARELDQTVDHVVPLQGKNVSGLHVEYNLQILPRSANSSKGNRFYSEET